MKFLFDGTILFAYSANNAYLAFLLSMAHYSHDESLLKEKSYNYKEGPDIIRKYQMRLI